MNESFLSFRIGQDVLHTRDSSLSFDYTSDYIMNLQLKMLDFWFFKIDLDVMTATRAILALYFSLSFFLSISTLINISFHQIQQSDPWLSDILQIKIIR